MKKIFTSIIIILLITNYCFADESIPEREKFLTPEVETAIEKGMEYLAKHQKKDGSFFDKINNTYKAPIQSVVLLAFLANGHLPELGKYGDVVRKGTDYLIDDCRDKITGMFGQNGYQHYFPVLILSQLFGEYRRTDLQDVLEAAVKLLVNAQNQNGGYGYSLAPVGDVETTAHCTAVEALRAAREAYMPVSEKVMDKAAKYIKTNQNRDGGFSYGMANGSSGWTRTGLGVVCLMACGKYDDKATKKGLDWLVKHKPPNAPEMNTPAYGVYYVSMALYQAGGEYWSKGYPAVQKWLLKLQKKNGSFVFPSSGLFGPMDTAFAVTALSFQKGLMPIFQR